MGTPELSETESKLGPGKRFVLVQSVLNSDCPGLGLALSLGLGRGLGLGLILVLLSSTGREVCYLSDCGIPERKPETSVAKHQK